MVLQDEFSNQAGKISSSYKTMMNDMMQWNRGVTQSAGAAFDYSTQVLGAMSDAYRHYAEISGEMFLVGKISGATMQQQKELMQLTKEVNLQTPLTNADIVSGERYLAMAGNSAEAIKSMIKPASELASIFNMMAGGKGGTADLMTNIMATFGIASKDAKKVADILYTATTSANINLVDLAQSLQYSGATFRNAGIDLATASAAIGVLGDQGIQASSAGTALANMIRYLTLSITGQKTKGTKMLEAMGISKSDLVDANGELKDLGTLMGVLADKMGRLSGTAREAAMYNIFGVRGQRAASGLFQAIWNGSGKMQNIIDKAQGSEGALDEAMTGYMNTDIGAIKQLTAAIDNLKTTIGSQESGVFSPIIRSATFLVQIFEKLAGSGVGKWIISLGTAATISSVIVNGFRLLSGLIRLVSYDFSSIATKTGTASGGMSGMNTQAAILEAHLRTIVALMAEYVGMAYYSPGTKGMMLPMGGRLSRNKNGKVYVGVGGKSMSTATYAGSYVPAGGSTPKGGSPTPSSTKFGWKSGLKGAAGGALMFLGGWQGIALTAGIMGLSYALDSMGNHTEENTKALKENTEAITQHETMQSFMERYTKAIIDASKSRDTEAGKLNITINGQAVGQYSAGETATVDDNGFYY
jgi:TP901 family phage tail tape measure protein